MSDHTAQFTPAQEARIRELVRDETNRGWADALAALPSMAEMGIDRNELPISASLHDNLKAIGLEASLSLECTNLGFKGGDSADGGSRERGDCSETASTSADLPLHRDGDGKLAGVEVGEIDFGHETSPLVDGLSPVTIGDGDDSGATLDASESDTTGGAE